MKAIVLGVYWLNFLPKIEKCSWKVERNNEPHHCNFCNLHKFLWIVCSCCSISVSNWHNLHDIMNFIQNDTLSRTQIQVLTLALHWLTLFPNPSFILVIVFEHIPSHSSFLSLSNLWQASTPVCCGFVYFYLVRTDLTSSRLHQSFITTCCTSDTQRNIIYSSNVFLLRVSFLAWSNQQTENQRISDGHSLNCTIF